MTSGHCFACDTIVGEESFCYGCGVHVCIGCSVNLTLIGAHDADDHLVDASFDDYEDDEEEV